MNMYGPKAQEKVEKAIHELKKEAIILDIRRAESRSSYTLALA